MTKTLKIMSITGIVLSVLFFLGAAVCVGDNDYSASSGYVTWACGYLLAFSIVGLVQYNRNKN